MTKTRICMLYLLTYKKCTTFYCDPWFSVWLNLGIGGEPSGIYEEDTLCILLSPCVHLWCLESKLQGQWTMLHPFHAFKHKNGATRYTHIKVGRNKSHFTSDPLNGDNKYTANDICKMIEFLVDNIYIRFGGQLFRQMVGIPMGTNCAPLLADLFLYSYEKEFLDKLIKEGKRKLARRFNLSYRYIDDLISFNNKRFKVFISDIYPKELTISETTESTSVASYLDLLFTRDRSNNIATKLYDKRDAFGFHIVNFPFMSSNIPSAPAYGVYASQLVRYARCCSNYSDFLICHRALVKRLLSQGYKVNRLSNTFKKFYGRHTDLVGQYKKNVCQMFADSISWNDFLFWWICQWPN